MCKNFFDFNIFVFSFSVTIIAYALPVKNTRHPTHFDNFAKICYKIIMHIYGNCLDLSSGAFDTCAFAPSPLIHAQRCYCTYVLLRCPYFRVPCPAFSTPSSNQSPELSQGALPPKPCPLLVNEVP